MVDWSDRGLSAICESSRFESATSAPGFSPTHVAAPAAVWFGKATGPRAFGASGLGGQIAWADPDSGLSFCYLTNGMEADIVATYVRSSRLSTLAAAYRRVEAAHFDMAEVHERRDIYPVFRRLFSKANA